MNYNIPHPNILSGYALTTFSLTFQISRLHTTLSNFIK